MASSPGIPLMSRYRTNQDLFESDDRYELVGHIGDSIMVFSVSTRELVALQALWQTFVMSTRELPNGADAVFEGVLPPTRMFIKQEINPLRKSIPEGTAPRGVVSEAVSSQLSSTLVYPGCPTLGQFKPVGTNRMMIGFGVLSSITKGVYDFVQRIRNGRKVVSSDVEGFERNFSQQMFMISAGVHSRTLSSCASKVYMYNYALTRCDNIYVMPSGELIRKVTPAIMPSGVIFTTLFNCIGRLFLSWSTEADAIVLGDDCVEAISGTFNEHQRAYELLGINLRDSEECGDYIDFCSARIYPNGDHVPTDSSFEDSFVQAVINRSDYHSVVQANTVRCIGHAAYLKCMAAADRVAKWASSVGIDVGFDPSVKFIYTGPNVGDIVYEGSTPI